METINVWCLLLAIVSVLLALFCFYPVVARLKKADKQEEVRIDLLDRLIDRSFGPCFIIGVVFLSMGLLFFWLMYQPFVESKDGQAIQLNKVELLGENTVVKVNGCGQVADRKLCLLSDLDGNEIGLWQTKNESDFPTTSPYLITRYNGDRPAEKWFFEPFPSPAHHD